MILFKKDMPHNQMWAGIDISICLLLASVGCVFAVYNFNQLFSDFHIYITGLARYHGGVNPYNVNDLLIYAFPPAISMIFNKITIAVFSIFLYLYSFSMLYLMARRDLLLVVFASMALLAGECGQSWISGNISFPFHLALSTTALEYARKNSKVLEFNMAFIIIVSSVFKLYFLSYLIVFIVPRKVPFFVVFIVISITILAYGAQIILDPIQWSDFVNAVRTQAIDRMDSGFTVYSNLLKIGYPATGLILHWLLLAIPGAIAIFLYRCNLCGLNRMAISAYLLSVAIFANPRLKEYDTHALNFCLYYVIYFTKSKVSCFENLFWRLAPLALTGYELTVRVALHFGVISVAWPGRTDIKEIAVYFLFLYTSWSIMRESRDKFTSLRSRSTIHEWLARGSRNETVNPDRL